MTPSVPEAQQYSRIKNLVFVTTIILDLIVFKVFFFSGQSNLLRDWAFSIFPQAVLANALYLFFFGLLLYAIHFPISLFSGYYWEHRYKLSNQNLLQWWLDDIKKNALGFCLMLVMMEVIYLFLGKVGQSWWVWASCFWIFVSVVLAKITPNVIVPLFFKYAAVENQSLKERIFKVFDDCKVALKDIYTINLSAKTKKANAFLCGLGKNRRVVLSDTLVEHFTPSEIEVVVAHELGHYKHHDIAKLLVIQSGFTFISFYAVDQLIQKTMNQFSYTEIDNIALLPMLLYFLTLINLMVMPFINWFSRTVEKEADRFSIEVTQKPEDFISLMEKLAKMNLAELKPNKWVERMLHDHPSIDNRINFAKTYLTKATL